MRMFSANFEEDSMEDNLTPETNVATDKTECLSAEDAGAMNSAKLNAELALSQAKEAIAKSQVQELQHKYLVLQLFFKYGLTEKDHITPQGVIVRGGVTNE